eukprot:CAMPEP_0194378956 /NCGR_PEP_ID=MMETSP0174-20130528/37221_1 /TAXON_ID=216777 /ORGANISM="Proboscia alata, Strain PI-D3" /LENGTH=436 /DNA_ID=CAMNT_0039161315 /DNA_START=227 /DNA_END=1537 /DNA_ORIENTATION=-
MADTIDVSSEGDDDAEEDEDEDDSNTEEAINPEFVLEESNKLTPSTSTTDWESSQKALKLRINDLEEGKTGTSQVMFRLMTAEPVNDSIQNFVSSANPDVVNAMSGAVRSLLGGLADPVMGMETIVKASGEKLGNLCFQLQMTGYMFRNAEYVLALKDIMDIQAMPSVSELTLAFEKIDSDNSGYIDASEVEALLQEVYKNNDPDAEPAAVPRFEIQTFLSFFDANRDGRISKEEFEKALGDQAQQRSAGAFARMEQRLQLPGSVSTPEEPDDLDLPEVEPLVSGTIEVELENGKVIEMKAKDYIAGLKAEAAALREAIKEERGVTMPPTGGSQSPMDPRPTSHGITQYISTLPEANVKKLTEGISTDVVDAMKLLVDYVLDRGKTPDDPAKKARNMQEEMEIAGSSLQQLAFWQLVLGYRLREAEATGEYRKMVD